MITWHDIQPQLNNLTPVSGGFSQAQRGLLTLPDGQEVFVKVGLHENTKLWAQKEIYSYQFLERHGYQHAPRLLAVNDDQTGFAIEALTAADGWDWKDNWDEARLRATLQAVQDLAAIDLTDEERAFFSKEPVSQTENGWVEFTDEANQKLLLDRLHQAGAEEVAAAIDFPADIARSQTYEFALDTLVHFDIRADNCAWNAKLGQVKAVDWNWTQLGDKHIELAATLTHVVKSGMTLPEDVAKQLNPDALHWIAGFWFNAAIKPIWPGGPEHLRALQLDSAVVALKLAGWLAA